ncbi:hypothetical protein E6C67_05520 [Azospirillum sp. TSA2s]|uniref:hypothetical protein n=1 Tax=Azospirillum sp. TSA2s TaxID=709810 RepID=UPI0010A9D732|nr:hypothetical protein [Azospirillum sp. TSA2s]QCG93403.1 hypothetical protein E6C67_05520 [Azospirillum sp. TSA2s]
MRRILILAAAAVPLMLAGCASENSSSYGTSGSTGANQQTVSPNEPGMGQSQTRKSLNDSNRAGSGASGMAYDNNETVSPNEPGMGQSKTRKSLPNTAGNSSSSSW